MRLQVSSLLLLALTVTVFAVPLGSGIPVALEERQFTALHQEISVYRSLQALRLTPAQRQSLLPALKEHVQEMMAIRDAQRNIQPEYETAMCALRDAVLGNNGVSEKVKYAVSKAEDVYSGPEHRHEEAGVQREKLFWELLTTAQVADLRRSRSAGYVDDAGWCAQQAAHVPARTAEADAVLGTLYRQYGLVNDEVSNAIAIGKPLLQGWQALPAGEARGAWAATVGKLAALPEHGIVSGDLPAGDAALLTDSVFTQKALHFLDASVPLPPVEDIESTSLKQVTAQVQVMNLVNTLYFTPEQMRGIIKLSTQANREFAALQAQHLAVIQRALPLLQQECATETGGGQPAPELLAQLAVVEKEAEKINDRVGKLEARIPGPAARHAQRESTADDRQLRAVYRAGAKPDEPRAYRAGERHQRRRSGTKRHPRVAGRQGARRGEKTAEQHGPAYLRYEHYADKDIAHIVGQIPGLVAQARALDDATFTLQKSQLASAISIPDHIAAGNELNGRVVYYLLCPNLISILQARLKWGYCGGGKVKGWKLAIP